MKWGFWGILFCGIFMLIGKAFAIEIAEMRLAEGAPGSVRFVAELTEENNPKVSRLENPARLVIDFPEATFSKKAKAQQFGKTGFVGGVRTGMPLAGTARVVLDLPKSSLTEKHFLLKPQVGQNWRFVLDLFDNVPEIIPAPSKAPVVTKEIRPITTQATVSTPTPLPVVPPPPQKRIIVLDAGHGGQDPGAISRSGHYEKDITLNMARETKALLEKAGFKVVLTRDKDIFIPLRGRIKKAHEANADLFISIHADSAKNPSARGLSIYTISERASDAEAAALAERENKADIILGMDLSDVDPLAGNVLLDLAKTDTMNKSAQYAKYVVREMKKTVQLVPNAHRMAGFVVLKSPNIPSVLVELGYLSNKTEDKNLQKKSYRQDLAEALVRAVKAYFADLAE
ncbi:MAG: N-acetylmuramoyl-L-alanine amidase [Alphaproteobacteria bacterium]|nr:N-acetylmuramoyl-L-alanine amidase [Alphaproteobacteria bacterium]